ncbi:MAG: hypothetical protein ABEI78_00705 [Candidatus Nanohaloarchaea archaeon]
METKITDVRENPLMDRKEIEIKLEHLNEATPSKEDVKNRIAAEKDIDESDIEVESVKTLFGENNSTAKLKVYSDFDYDEEKYENKDIEVSEEYTEIVNQTITEVKDQLSEIENPDYREAKKAEKQNKNRKTLIEWFENQIEN